MLNKKYLFGGVVNTVLALSAFTQNSIAQDKCLSFNDSLNLLNQLSWRVIANREVIGAGKGSWITKTEYSESIRNVIGKAIADCLTEDNEFAGKKENEVIKFKADPTKVKYSPANWNAVVLWNLIHVCKQEYKKYDEFDMEFDSEFDIEKAFKTVGECVKNEYSKIENINKMVNDSIEQINEYVQKLHFVTYFKNFLKTKKDLDEWRAKNLSDTGKITEKESHKLTPIFGLTLNEKAKKWLFEPPKSMAGNAADISVKDLEFEPWGWRLYTGYNISFLGKPLGKHVGMFVPLNGVVYCPEEYKIKIEPISFSDQIIKIEVDDLWIIKNKSKDEKRKFTKLSGLLQKDISTVVQYIANGKKPADVESMYYDAKDGWHINYKQ